jgi:hypothetical protein
MTDLQVRPASGRRVPGLDPPGDIPGGDGALVPVSTYIRRRLVDGDLELHCAPALGAAVKDEKGQAIGKAPAWRALAGDLVTAFRDGRLVSVALPPPAEATPADAASAPEAPPPAAPAKQGK